MRVCLYSVLLGVFVVKAIETLCGALDFVLRGLGAGGDGMWGREVEGPKLRPYTSRVDVSSASPPSVTSALPRPVLPPSISSPPLPCATQAGRSRRRMESSRSRRLPSLPFPPSLLPFAPTVPPTIKPAAADEADTLESSSSSLLPNHVLLACSYAEGVWRTTVWQVVQG